MDHRGLLKPLFFSVVVSVCHGERRGYVIQNSLGSPRILFFDALDKMVTFTGSPFTSHASATIVDGWCKILPASTLFQHVLGEQQLCRVHDHIEPQDIVWVVGSFQELAHSVDIVTG